MRINDAIADGSFFENEVLLAACEAARRGPARPPSPDGPGLRRRRALGLGAHRGVHRARRRSRASRTSSSTRSPTAATRCRPRRPATSRRSSAGCGGRGGSAPSAAATTRWTATGAGSGSSSPTTRSSTPRGSGPRPRSRRSREAHERGETDEFIRPTVIGDYDGMATGDAVLHFNFRPDRARELMMALGEPDFDEFDRGRVPDVHLATMTEYRAGWDYPVAFPPRPPATTLAAVLAERGERQLHVAETEKYAHVTYFFNGGREREWEGEERCLVDSPRDVPTYDHKPEMSAAGGRRRVRRPLAGGRLPVRDHQLRQRGHGRPHRRRSRRRSPRSRRSTAASARSSRRSQATGGACIVTADHGNADNMLEPDGSPNTAHSTQPGAADRHRRRASSSPTAGSSPTSRRPRWRCSGSSSRPR